VGIEGGNADSNAESRFVDELESSRAEREGNADDAVRKFMELSDSESLLGWNDMLLESLVGNVVAVEGGRWKQCVLV
jgi:hypothetical protein